ncbi:UNVERIFIED_CONTAM: hypothetical protein GTU68_034039, partial [Idotea baltica]|nr:hypothetical protein [Idotea baltica]
SIIALYITFPNESTAREIGNQVLLKRLVACANYFPMRSAYWWQGQVENDSEWVAFMKTTAEGVKNVEAFVRTVHPYDVPCIVNWEVHANADYEDWVRAEVTS